jgi:XapX domain-containing protein
LLWSLSHVIKLYQGAIAMVFKQAGLSLLGGWIIGVVFMAVKLPAPVPPLLGLIGAAGVLLGGYCYEIIAKLLLKQ